MSRVSAVCCAVKATTGVVGIAAAAGTVKALMIPFGTHVYTGHLYGKAGGDWIGYYVLTNEEMTYLGGGTYGTLKSEIASRTPWYVAPTDMTITTVDKLDSEDGYFSNNAYRFVVIGKIDLPIGSSVNCRRD